MSQKANISASPRKRKKDETPHVKRKTQKSVNDSGVASSMSLETQFGREEDGDMWYSNLGMVLLVLLVINLFILVSHVMIWLKLYKWEHCCLRKK